MLVRECDTLKLDLEPVSGWQNHIVQFDSADLIKNFPGLMAQPTLLTQLSQTFPEHIGQKTDQQMSWIIESAEKEKVTPSDFARRVAMERFNAVKAAAENRSITTRLMNYALDIYRKGKIPPILTAPLAGWYFNRKFG